MTVKVGINGFGSIGRRFYRKAMLSGDVEVVAINDLTPPATLAHLLKYDSNYGTLTAPVTGGDGELRVGDRRLKVTTVRDPKQIPWAETGVELVVESTGRFVDRDSAGGHLRDGVRKVIISAPAKGEDITIVMGVNDAQYRPTEHHIISNASCTTNCLGPVAKVLNDAFGIVKGMMNTVHAYTNDQVILDFGHSDLRRARAGALSIIPTSTGAAKAIHLVLPELKGKLNGFSLRVPTPTVSVLDLTVETAQAVTAEAVNGAMREAAGKPPLRGILSVSDEPLVSVDYKGSEYSAVIDSLSTLVVGGNLVKVLAWYDNEWGYSTRLLDLIKLVLSQGL